LPLIVRDVATLRFISNEIANHFRDRVGSIAGLVKLAPNLYEQAIYISRKEHRPAYRILFVDSHPNNVAWTIDDK
jgi:hypothetical protein